MTKIHKLKLLCSTRSQIFILLVLIITTILFIKIHLQNGNWYFSRIRGAFCNDTKNQTVKLLAHPDMPFRLTGHDKELALELLAAFHLAAEELQFNYVLYAGSLLGAIRHQGFIPWDDDIDLLVADKENRNEAEWTKLITKFVNTMGPKYSSSNKLIYHVNGSTEVRNFKPVRWPMLDVFPIFDNGTHWGWTKYRAGWSKAGFVPYKMIFPLRIFSFETLRLQVPQEPLHFFNWASDSKSEYGALIDCCQERLNHKTWYDSNKKVCYKCDELKQKYSYKFVETVFVK